MTITQLQPTLLVVAVDGSPESAEALRWARDQAARNGSRLRIVTAHALPSVQTDSAGAYWDQYEAAGRRAKERAAAAINAVLGHSDVDHVVVPGPIERALTEHAKDASMIVVGTRRTDGWLSRLRRSATNRITGQTTCPVVSVPAPRSEMAFAAA